MASSLYSGVYFFRVCLVIGHLDVLRYYPLNLVSGLIRPLHSDKVIFLMPLSKPPIIGSVPVHSRCLRSTIFTLFRFILNGKPDICVLSNTGTPFFMRISTPLLCQSLHVEKLEIIFHTVSALASISVSALTSELFMAQISGKYNASNRGAQISEAFWASQRPSGANCLLLLCA